jgi:2-polyprenyl-6-methoxyphenol hydroxylase-like FAD-dependent oxidoreductase
VTDYDVVIVGGRPAGSTLAARLGARGHRVLLVDRASFPSQPSVPSSPVIYPSAMKLLDELGIDEASYAGASFTTFSFQLGHYFDTVIPVPEMFGRAYVYGIDRHHFDEVLWRNVSRFGTVEQRQGFAVGDLLRDDEGRVTGVIGRERGGVDQRITARCVIGADGRFSLIARKAGARVVEEETECVSTVYFAEWEGVAPFREGVQGAHIHATGRGLDVLFFPMPGDRWSVNTHHRADRVVTEGDPMAYYMSVIASQPDVARRLSGARRISPLVGLKRVGNGYRESSGPGWALVGDAVHYKDPVDGQGIYDALVEARVLAGALDSWLTGKQGWAEAMRDYQQGMHAETHPMYLETMGRLRRELYEEPPPIIARTLIRWMMTDPAYQKRFLQFLGRELPAKGWLSKRLVGGAILRGIGRDLSGRSARMGAPEPAGPPALR